MSNRSNINITGSAVTGENIGGGQSIFAGKTCGTNLQFKSIIATGSLSVISGATTLTLFGSASGQTVISGATNGLSTFGTFVGNLRIGLGGTITGNTNIFMTGNTFLGIGWCAGIGGGANGSRIIVCNGSTEPNKCVNISSKNISSCSEINVATTGITIGGTGVGFQGAKYNANYCANYTNRSLVDKEYVDTHISTGATGGIGWSNLGDGSTVAGCGTVPSGSTITNNTFYGVCAGSCITTGFNNVAIGTNALTSNTCGCFNTAIGVNALTQNISGTSNIALGTNALFKSTISNENIALGSYSLTCNTKGCRNIGIGVCTLLNNISGCYNIAMGYETMFSNTGGTFNIAIGTDALHGNIIGNNNIAIGFQALYSNTGGTNNIANGTCALFNNLGGTDNIANGLCALFNNTSGNNNIANGLCALLNNTIGSFNISNGYLTLFNNISGCHNTAAGYQSLFSNTVGCHNIATGFWSLKSNICGNDNISLGAFSLSANICGQSNIGIGISTLGANTTGCYNTAIGYQALGASITGNFNVAYGYCALNMNLSGNNNIGIGNAATFDNLIGDNNIGIGNCALYFNTGGTENIAIGNHALFHNLLNSNIGLGVCTLFFNSGGTQNIAIGNKALLCNNNGNCNVAIGNGAGFFETGSSKLHISNKCTINPLIHGDFSAKCVTINGQLAVTGVTTCNTANIALIWDSGTSLIHGFPTIEEWVGSPQELLFAGQKFAYPTQTIMQTDVSTCVVIPNYIQICNINLQNVGDTQIFVIPSGKTALLNRAKLIILNNASPTCFSISIGNNACIPIPNCSYNNLANLQQISDVLKNETYELDLSTRHQAVPATSGTTVFFRVGSGSTSICNLCAHLLIEGFVY